MKQTKQKPNMKQNVIEEWDCENDMSFLDQDWCFIGPGYMFELINGHPPYEEEWKGD